MLEFDACVGGSEVPVGLGVVGIAAVLPGGDFIDEGLFRAGLKNLHRTISGVSA
jgi:hypothetical protein